MRYSIRKICAIALGSYLFLCAASVTMKMSAAIMGKPMGDYIPALDWPIAIIVWVGQVWERIQTLTG